MYACVYLLCLPVVAVVVGLLIFCCFLFLLLVYTLVFTSVSKASQWQQTAADAA